MKHKLCFSFLICVLLICASDFIPMLEGANKTKLILGACMIAGGAALSIHAAENSVLSDDHNFEFGAGIATAGVGTSLLVLGFLQNDKNEMRQQNLVPERKIWSIGVAPRRSGLSGGMIIRW